MKIKNLLMIRTLKQIKVKKKNFYTKIKEEKVGIYIKNKQKTLNDSFFCQ